MATNLRKVIEIVEGAGWVYHHTRGSHAHYYHPSKPGVVTVPVSRNKDIKRGTLNSILRQARLK